MQNSRRKFIQNASLVLAGASLKPSVLWSKNDTIAKTKNLIGIQLYSVRADMGKNPLGTLTELAKMGYEHVEHANYINRKFYGWTATEFKKVLDSLGLHMPSGHTVMDLNHFDKAKNDFTDAWKYTIDDAATLGQTYVISPSIDSKVRKSFDAFMFQVELFNKCGELCKKQGMKFGYHNHDFEFKEKVNGELIYDLILKHTDPSLVVQQLDFGNMYGAGARGDDWINKYPGRFPSLHVKDEIKVANDQVGQPTSTIDLAHQIVNLAETGLSSGIYHGSNSGKATWWEFACALMELSGENSNRILPVLSQEFQTKTKRPEYSVLDHSEWQDSGVSPMRPWRTALEAIYPEIHKAVERELANG